MQSALEELIEEVEKLQTLLSDMQARGDRVPFEAEERLHTIEGLLAELVKTLTLGAVN